MISLRFPYVYFFFPPTTAVFGFRSVRGAADGIVRRFAGRRRPAITAAEENAASGRPQDRRLIMVPATWCAAAAAALIF